MTEPPPPGKLQGTVSRWTAKGYGFITPDEGGDDLFCHFSKIEDGNALQPGTRVHFVKWFDEAKGTHRAVEVVGGFQEARGFYGGGGGGGGRFGGGGFGGGGFGGGGGGMMGGMMGGAMGGAMGGMPGYGGGMGGMPPGGGYGGPHGGQGGLQFPGYGGQPSYDQFPGYGGVYGGDSYGNGGGFMQQPR